MRSSTPDPAALVQVFHDRLTGRVAWDETPALFLAGPVSHGCILGQVRPCPRGHPATVMDHLAASLEVARQIRHARDLLTRPDNSVASIARLLGVSRSSLYKHVPELSSRRNTTSIPTSEETPMAIIPPRFANATTTLAEADRWCDSVLNGTTTRLLLLGPIWSGKTHHAYAMLKRILNAGYPSNNISVHEAYDLVYASDYKPRDFEAGTPVTFIDDLTNRVDNRVGATTELAVDDPMTQSVMAAGQGALIDALDRLVSRSDASWIACASGKEALAACLGKGVAEKLITSAHMVVELPPRPLP